MRSSLISLVTALIIVSAAIWGYAETAPVHHEEVVLEVELVSTSGDTIPATITRVKRVEHHELKDLAYLIKMTAAKHIKGIKSPSAKAVNKIPDSALPERATSSSSGDE